MSDEMKEETNTKNAKHTSVDAIILVALVVVLGALGGYYLMNRSPKQTNVPTSVSPSPVVTQEQSVPTTIKEPASTTTTVTTKPVNSPTPSPKPIPHGSKNFYVSIGSEVKGPRMGKGTIDPYDPVVGGKQRLTIEVNDTVPVQKVVAIIKTDKKTSEPHMLTAGAGVTNKGNWSGEWTMDDSYLYTYILSIQATSASGTSSVDITLR
ncbi:MAG: hypothetical protein WAV30_03630 [Microgenomates group bacterium]